MSTPASRSWPSRNAADEPHEQRVGGEERRRAARVGVAVVGDREEPAAVPAAPDVDRPADVMLDDVLGSGRVQRLGVLGLEDEVGKQGSAPDQEPRPEEDLERVAGEAAEGGRETHGPGSSPITRWSVWTRGVHSAADGRLVLDRRARRSRRRLGMLVAADRATLALVAAAVGARRRRGDRLRALRLGRGARGRDRRAGRAVPVRHPSSPARCRRGGTRLGVAKPRRPGGARRRGDRVHPRRRVPRGDRAPAASPSGCDAGRPSATRACARSRATE